MSFDFVAPHYRWLESIAFANTLQHARTNFIDQIPAPRHVLIAGEGDGRFLREFTRKFPKALVDCVDASARMLDLARARAVGRDDRVRFLQNDLLRWSPGENMYDLIVTHFFLDCFNEVELETIVSRLAKSATRDAVWLLSDFSIPSPRFQKMHAQTWLWVMHHFFRAVAGISARKLIDPSPFLRAHGFHCEHAKNSRFGLVKSEIWRG